VIRIERGIGVDREDRWIVRPTPLGRFRQGFGLGGTMSRPRFLADNDLNDWNPVSCSEPLFVRKMNGMGWYFDISRMADLGEPNGAASGASSVC